MLKRTLLILITAASLPVTLDAAVVERIVAVVNDKAITMSDLEEEMAIRRQLAGSADRSEVLDYIIEREIVSAEAAKLGVNVTMNEISDEIVHFEETFSSREEFNRFIEQYELNIQDISKIFAYSVAINKVRQQKEAISQGRYQKWLDEIKKKIDIRIVEQ